jgi:hypothetical protein
VVSSANARSIAPAHPFDQPGADRDPFEHHAGRLDRQLPHQRREQQFGLDVGHGEPQHALFGGGIERRFDQQTLQLRQQRRQRLPQGIRARRQHRAAGPAHQQRIAQQRAQAAERAAHRRLAEPDRLARACRVAVVQQRVEHRQQVEIDRAKMPVVHGWHNELAFHTWSSAA